MQIICLRLKTAILDGSRLGFQAEVATGMSGDVWCVPATIQRGRPFM